MAITLTNNTINSINITMTSNTVTEKGASTAFTASTTPINPFDRIMTGKAPKDLPVLRDICKRPPFIPTDKYDPYRPPPIERPSNYSPYHPGEPLFDDRACILANFPSKNIVLAGPPKRPRSNWAWNLGYAVVDSKKDKAVLWLCKLCHHD